MLDEEGNIGGLAAGADGGKRDRVTALVVKEHLETAAVQAIMSASV